MSSSFGGGGNGEIKYVVSVDVTQAAQGFQSLNQNFQQLQQTGQQTAQGIQQLPTALDQATQSTGKFSQANADLAAELQATDIGAKEVAKSQQSFGQVVRQNITSIVQIGTGITGLVANYFSLQRAQIMINRLQIQEQNQRRILGILTRQHAEAVAKYGVNSREATDIENKRVIVEQKLGMIQDQLALKEEQRNLGMINLGLSSIQTAAGIAQVVVGLTKAKPALDGAAAATMGLSNSMRALKAATIIGSILLAIEVAAQTVANNFGGLRDRITDLYNWLVKVAPVFKPVIDAIWTLGQGLTALFTGDMDAFKKIFSQTASGATDAAGGLDDMGESATQAGKEIQELKDQVNEFQKVGTELIVKASQGDKKEQRSFLKSLGIKGDEKEKMRDVLDAVEDATKQTEEAASKLEALEGFNILEKLGFDIPEDVIKDIQNTIDSDLRDIISGKNDPFNKLADILEESPNKEKYGETLSKWVAENPDLFEALKKFDPRLASAIESYIATFQTTAQAKLDTVKLEVPDSVWDAAFAMPGQHVEFLNGEKVVKGFDVSGLIASIKKGINEGDWSGVGDATVTKAKDAIKAAWAKKKTETGGTDLGVVLAFNDFFNKEMEKSDPFAPTRTVWENKIGIFINDIQLAIKGIAVKTQAYLDSNPIFGGLQILSDANDTGDVLTPAEAYDWLSKNVGEPITTGYNNFINHPVIKALHKLLTDPIGAIADLITAAGEAGKAVKTSDFKFPDIVGTIQKNIIEPLQKKWDEITNSDWFKGLGAFFSGQTAEAFTGSWTDQYSNKNPVTKGSTSTKGLSSAFTNQFPSTYKWTPPHTTQQSGTYNTNDPAHPVYVQLSPQTGGALGGAGALFGEVITRFLKDHGISFAEEGGPIIQNPLRNAGSLPGPTTSGSRLDNQRSFSMPTIADMQKGNIAGAGSFKSMITEAANASKGIQTEFSSMFTALTGIFTGIGKSWSVIMNSFGKNSASGGNQIRVGLGTAFQDVFDTMVDLAGQWSKIANSFGKNSVSAGKQIRKAFASALQDVYDTMADVAKQWSKLCNSMGKNSASAGKQIRSAFAKALQDVYDTMQDLAKQWSKVCNSMGANAKSAAKQINSALGSIKDVDVTVRVGLSGPGRAYIGKGGAFSLAKGGIVSAAGGYTTNGPQLLIVGDNPGGRETIAAIPNNAPANMMNALNRRFGSGGQEGSVVNQTVNLMISGAGIINETKLNKKIRMEVGKNRDRFG